MILRELITKIEEKYPKFLAESWDNVGLMVGDFDAEIQKILVVLEANEAVIREAIQEKVDLIITHHPFFFSKINQVNSDSLKGSLTLALIQNNIALYSMHTNYDIAFDGMNDQFLSVIGYQATDCFHFANAMEWYVAANHGKTPGLGRLVELDTPLSVYDLCQQLKAKLNMNQIRLVGNPSNMISKIAVITGSAADMFSEAKAAGADVLISGDMKYHIAQDALDAGMTVIDCGHFETENIFKNAMKKYLESICDCKVIASQICLNPFCYL